MYIDKGSPVSGHPFGIFKSTIMFIFIRRCGLKPQRYNEKRIQETLK